MSIQKLFSAPLQVVNLGIESFKEACEKNGAPAVQVDWRPPVEVAPESEAILAKRAAQIEKANRKVMEIILAGTPKLVGLDVARNVIPGMTEDTILHAGPPITWERMSGPMKGAVTGALVFEGLAKTLEEAAALAASGEITFSPCHEHNCVGSMAGVTSACDSTLPPRCLLKSCACALSANAGRSPMRIGPSASDPCTYQASSAAVQLRLAASVTHIDRISARLWPGLKRSTPSRNWNRSIGESKKWASPLRYSTWAAQIRSRAGYMPHTGQRADSGTSRGASIGLPLAGS